MGWENLYIITAILGFGVILAGARILSGYSRDSVKFDPAPHQQREPQLEKSGEAGRDTPVNRTPKYLTVSFSESSAQFLWDPDASCLLDFILTKGIEVDCLCQAGECGACKTRVIAGEVTYLQEPKIKPGEGYCLLCITVPKSNLVLAR
ncbi:MAG: 2Fe-2S iron-sulfur cluster-binding protein [Candidatus Thiodiazotropha sp.]